MDVGADQSTAVDLAAPDLGKPMTFAQDVVRAGDVCGILYTPERAVNPQPGLLVLGGSEGRVPRGLAGMLAMLGYAVFAQAYVDPSRAGHPFRRIPVERLERGLELLADIDRVDPHRLGVIGISKGGEAALLLASRVPQLRAVIGINASGIVFQSPSKLGGSSWTERGKELPYARLPSLRLALMIFRHRRGLSGDVRLEPVYRAAAEKARADAVIPLERSHAHLLLISGEDDGLWPATMLAERAVERARTAPHQRLVIHLSYPGAGHDLAPQPNRETISATNAGSKVTLALGGDPEVTRRARIDAWNQIRTFLDRNLE